MEKTLQLNNYSVLELTFEESLALDGGSFWERLGEIMGVVAGILVVGIIVSLIILTA
ncbi:MAG: hypothetical protein ACK5R0_08840 [Bacteroidota bacterium]|jgi:hypothetical protein